MNEEVILEDFSEEMVHFVDDVVEPKAFGGVLILFVIGTVIAPFTFIFQIIEVLGILRDEQMMLMAETINDRVAPFLYVEFVYIVVMFIVFLYSAYLFFNKKEAYIKIRIMMYVGTLLYSLTSLWAFTGAETYVISEMMQSLVISAIIGGFAILYLKLSKRVKETFIR